MPARRTYLRSLGHLRAITPLSIGWIAVSLSVSGPAADFHLEVDEDRISISSSGADIGDILRSLAEEADFRLLMPADLSRQSTSLQMQNAPLKRVLNRLLRDDSFVIITGDDERVVAVHVLPRGNEQTVFQEIDDHSNSDTESQHLTPENPQVGADESVNPIEPIDNDP